MSDKRICNHPGCGKEVIDANGIVVHAGGGTLEQRCRECGWKGGQVQTFVQCPRCGSRQGLQADHNAC